MTKMLKITVNTGWVNCNYEDTWELPDEWESYSPEEKEKYQMEMEEEFLFEKCHAYSEVIDE